MTIVEALKLDSDLSLKKWTGYNRGKYLRFNVDRNLWVIEAKFGSKYVELLETEYEELAVAKLLEEDDASL